VLLVTVAACGSNGTSSKESTTTESTPSESTTAPAARLQVTSTAFTDGGAIPKEFTCDGANQSLPLAWTGRGEPAEPRRLSADGLAELDTLARELRGR